LAGYTTFTALLHYKFLRPTGPIRSSDEGSVMRVATIFDGLALAMIDGEVGLEGEVDGVSGFRFPSRV
jgi:hypothetical protein